MNLHVHDSSDFEAARALRTLPKSTADLLVLLDLIQRVYFSTVGIVCASYLSKGKYTSEFRSLQCIQKLHPVLLGLFAIAALFPRFLPSLDARFAVDRTLAQVTIHRRHLLGHYDLLTNDAEGVWVQIKLVQLLAILDAILCHKVLLSAILRCSLVERRESHSTPTECFVEQRQAFSLENIGLLPQFGIDVIHFV